MQVEQWRPEAPAPMTFDEVSMERSKSFVKALQELKNLRPQLYSAAEYCEKSYLHSEQKQMVLDNLKDYAVKALVNAVDHLGTVAYKLTDLFEQQSVDVSNVELKISCLNQKILTCQHYMDKEGLRQQQLLGTSTRHHKHYFLPNSNAGKTRIGSQLNASGKNHGISGSHSHSQGNPTSKSLSWHLASESYSMPNKSSSVRSEQDSMFSISFEGSRAYKANPHDFHLLDAVESTVPLSPSAHLESRNGAAQSPMVPRNFGYTDLLDVPNSLSTVKSLDNPYCEIRPAARNKSMLSVFFAKNKHSKQRKAYA